MIRIGMLTSGGDCQALNAAMRGVVKTLVNSGEKVEIYGFLDGYRGLIYGNYRMLTGKDFPAFSLWAVRFWVHPVHPSNSFMSRTKTALTK